MANQLRYDTKRKHRDLEDSRAFNWRKRRFAGHFPNHEQLWLNFLKTVTFSILISWICLSWVIFNAFLFHTLGLTTMCRPSQAGKVLRRAVSNPPPLEMGGFRVAKAAPTWRIIPVGKWLITMVSKSPKDRVVPLPKGLNASKKRGLLTTYLLG